MRAKIKPPSCKYFIKHLRFSKLILFTILVIQFCTQRFFFPTISAIKRWYLSALVFIWLFLHHWNKILVLTSNSQTKAICKSCVITSYRITTILVISQNILRKILKNKEPGIEQCRALKRTQRKLKWVSKIAMDKQQRMLLKTVGSKFSN